MRMCLPSIALLLALAACASHPPRCGRRLTLINPQLLRPSVIASPGGGAVHSTKAAHS